MYIKFAAMTSVDHLLSVLCATVDPLATNATIHEAEKALRTVLFD